MTTYGHHRSSGDSTPDMIFTRDIGVGATIYVNSVPLDQKYTVAVLLGVAICEKHLEFFPSLVSLYCMY